jgi:succinylglutamate desuccinylase
MDLTNLIVILKSGRMYGTSRVLLLFKIASRFVKLLCGIHMDPTNPIIILKKLKNKRRLMLPPMTQLLTLFSFFFIIKQKITKPCKWVEV